jgi:hypothetical protein
VYFHNVRKIKLFGAKSLAVGELKSKGSRFDSAALKSKKVFSAFYILILIFKIFQLPFSSSYSVSN